MAKPLLSSIAILVALASIAPAATLENKHVEISFDEQHGGAIVKIVHKDAPSFPYIADRGAKIAGQGRLLVPVVMVGEKRFSLADVAMRVDQPGPTNQLILEADLSHFAPGLHLERRFVLADDESGLRVTDTFTDGDKDEIKLRIGNVSVMEGQPWAQTLRCWFGDPENRRAMWTPSQQETVSRLRSTSTRPYWRVIGQYGTGLLCLPRVSRSPVDIELRMPKEDGCPAEFQWMAAETTLRHGNPESLFTSLLVDTGGREGNTSTALLQSDRMIVHGDVPAASRNGEIVDCFVTVTSAVPRRVRAVVTEQTVRVNWAKESDRTESRQIASFDLDLPAGLGVVRGFQYTPASPGLSCVHLEVQDLAGKTLTSTETRTVVEGQRGADGDFAKTWERYVRKLPEYHFHGSWEDIGRQMARIKAISPRAGAPHGAERMALYEKRFPIYAKLLHGAAAELGCPAEQLAGADRGGRAGMADACMGLIVYGPDGPLHLYSKERDHFSFDGMAYLKVVPDSGYRYHMYALNSHFNVGYGVNSAGLSTSGTTINCDAETERIGESEAATRIAEGKATAPLAVQMLLATCGDVEEAIRFIEDPDAPFEFTGNMLIADLKGNSAVIESAGTRHQILRGKQGRPMDTGNYSHRRADGLFAIGDSWPWAANTMLRERLFTHWVDEHLGQVNLADARMFMATRAEPGGMCQHLVDNVGTLYSTCSTIIVLRTRDLYISDGPPDQVQYVRYRLGDD